MNAQDADITTVLDPPSICSQRDATLGLQVKLSRLLSSIITSQSQLYPTEILADPSTLKLSTDPRRLHLESFLLRRSPSFIP